MKCLTKAGWGVPQQPALVDLAKDLCWWHVWDRPSCFLGCWQKTTVVALSIMWGEPVLLSTSLPLVALRETWWHYVGSLSVDMGGMGKTGLNLTLWPMVTHSTIRKNQRKKSKHLVQAVKSLVSKNVNVCTWNSPQHFPTLLFSEGKDVSLCSRQGRLNSVLFFVHC